MYNLLSRFKGKKRCTYVYKIKWNQVTKQMRQNIANRGLRVGKQARFQTWNGRLETDVSAQTEMSLRSGKIELKKGRKEEEHRLSGRGWPRPRCEGHHILHPGATLEPQTPALADELQHEG